MQKEDDRIRIITNKKNMGTLYARCVGTLSAKGKYIIPMDADDMFLNKDVFDVLINIEMKSNFDIIIYNSISSSLKPHLIITFYDPDFFDERHEPNRVLFQPDLGYYPTSPGDIIDKINFNEQLIHGKLIKRNIYNKAIYKLGYERYSRFTIFGEDNLMVNSIFNVAKIAKFIIDFTLDSQRNKKVLVNFILSFFKFENLKSLLYNSEYDNSVFISCLDRILNCKYISDEDKNEIRKRGKMLKFIKYNF